MTKEEFFDLYYPGLKYVDFSESRNMIQNALWESYDEGKIIDVLKFKFAYQVCVPLYNKLKEYEDQIRYNYDEIFNNYGTPSYSLETLEEITDPIQDMEFICDTYHKYFEFVDLTLLPDDSKKKERIGSDEETKQLITVDYIDSEPDHRKWFIKVLNSKIPAEQSVKDQFLIESLNLLFDKLCDLNCLDSNKENRNIFIYRFSGFNGTYPPEMKILWKGKQVFLGYIIRCLISDRTTDPVGLGTAASFFYSKSGDIKNLSVDNYTVKDFDKEKDNLHAEFVKAVELLRECGFINVEYTSARR